MSGGSMGITHAIAVAGEHRAGVVVSMLGVEQVRPAGCDSGCTERMKDVSSAVG